MKQPVRTVLEADTLHAAARAMRESDVGFVPVCSEDGAMVGVLTDRDIVTRACAEDERPSTLLVRAVMSRGIVSCGPDDSVARAMARMRRHRLTRIVILDWRGFPVGVLSLSDIAQYERPSRVGRTLQTVAERKYTTGRP
jgi:CBS domain-containing protein